MQRKYNDQWLYTEKGYQSNTAVWPQKCPGQKKNQPPGNSLVRVFSPSSKTLLANSDCNDLDLSHPAPVSLRMGGALCLSLSLSLSINTGIQRATDKHMRHYIFKVGDTPTLTSMPPLHLWRDTRWLAIGSLSNNDGNGRGNLTVKGNFARFMLYNFYSVLFGLTNIGNFFFWK